MKSNCNLYNKIYTRELLGGASRSSHSFKNFNKHVKYKIQQPQLFTDYNLYIVQKRFSFHMFHNGTKIKQHYRHRQVTLWKPIEADEHLKMKWGCVCNRGEVRMKMNTWDVNHIEKRKKRNLESLEGCLFQQKSLKSWNISALDKRNLCGIQKQKQKPETLWEKGI